MWWIAPMFGKNPRDEPITQRYNRRSRLLQPEPEPDVNWGVIRDWLQDCCANHKGDVNKEADSTIIPQMRVFDVEEGCVVMAPPHCKYASLSYVWGKPSDQDLSARTENITNLEKKGYLYKNLPTATFHDAMVACAKLGLRYLGTDRLCILQDAIQDKHTQVNAMDVIYSCSVVTLVVLAGVNAHYDLPGVHMRKRTPWPILETQGLYLIREPDTYTKACDFAVWASRGWTLQEAVLSPRLLFFTNDGVYFECCHDPFVKDENAFVHPNYKRDRCKGQSNLSSSNDLVKQYTQRSLRSRKEDGCSVFVEGCGLDMQSWWRIRESTPNIQIDVLAMSLELYPHSKTAWHHPRNLGEKIFGEELSYWRDSAGQPLYLCMWTH
ncbi:unnamed protein product [Aspergillus oryzae]|uniref:Unnamed protein product n=2 Tax=Aspergillus oryzae TaxID=5062 RepID=A0AAN4YAW6_ASPOZ|nr:unnamed protein product [Aspergillus oryzae]GMF86005.1 unnamed protein product [Aspergillus oryzae]GMG14204.1 unnamed protein product [Aspergillus oryzae]GMG22616.1 unnamed protein product [Aspergillus oryzae]GMG46895.1 unnamed protein product [Aspergillus oryzae var. brunneus]